MSSQNALDHALVCCKQHALSYVQRRIDEEIFQSTSISACVVGELLVDIVADGSKLMWKEFQSLEAGKGIKVTNPRYAATLREFQQQFNDLSKKARSSITERRVKAKTTTSSESMDDTDAMDVVGDDDARVTLDAPSAASGRSKGKKRKSHDLEEDGEPEEGEQNNSQALSTSNKRRKSQISFGASDDAPKETRNSVEEQAAATSTPISSSAPSTPRRRRSILEDGKDSAEKALKDRTMARVKLLVPPSSSDKEENVPAKTKTGLQATSSPPATDSNRSPLDASKAKVHNELKERAAARASQLRDEKKKKK